MNASALNTCPKNISNNATPLDTYLNAQNFSIGAFFNQMSINELLESGNF